MMESKPYTARICKNCAHYRSDHGWCAAWAPLRTMPRAPACTKFALKPAPQGEKK